MAEAASTSKSSNRRVQAVLIIMIVAWLLSLLVGFVLPSAISRADEFFYDAYYRTRISRDMSNADVVLVAADQASLDAVNKNSKYGWPWPREFWGVICTYLDHAGAKAIAFDIVFSETSAYQTTTGDDDNFASAMHELKTPVIFGSAVTDDGHWQNFSPPIKSPAFGAVNVGDDKIYRRYIADVNGKPSLAVATLQAVGINPAAPQQFLLHFYGPHLLSPAKTTFPYVSAANVLYAQLNGEEKAKSYGITPDMFKGKIVILCGTAAATYDLKSSPLSAEFPGPEVHATAIENLLAQQAVHPLPAWLMAIIALCGAGFVSTGVILPRRATLKLLFTLLPPILLLTLGILLFRGDTIHFLPPVQTLLAILLAAPAAFAWTYFAEDRQRRFMLKALSKVVSPAVAQQLAADPERLALGTVRTDLTVLFTDLANFTDLSESLEPPQLESLLNRYLGEMSDQVLHQNGTLDKYIGDAVMCFWNAPLPQKDHAALACHAALAMIRREKELHAEFAALGTKHIFTRIGINTATVAVGFIGSDHLFNYTALGDGVNLASRLEGANKLYGTRILLSGSTAQLVQDQFQLRKVDLLRVKGKKQAMPVYELLAARAGSDPAKFQDLSSRYHIAFDLYQQRKWDTATAAFLELSRVFGEDGPSQAMLARIDAYRRSPPDESWDGVYDSKEK